MTLQNLAQVRGGELSVCYEAVAPFYNATAMQYPLYISTDTPVQVCTRKKRLSSEDSLAGAKENFKASTSVKHGEGLQSAAMNLPNGVDCIGHGVGLCSNEMNTSPVKTVS